MPVSRLVSVTLAPGITPPDESVTVPTTVPIDDCANVLPTPIEREQQDEQRKTSGHDTVLLESRTDSNILYR